MKYTLNNDYNGEVIATQCGYIFRKEVPTEAPDKKSFELENYINQKFIVPFKEEVVVEEKPKETIERPKETIEKPKGVSTIEKKDDTLKPKAEQKVDSKN